MKQNQVMLSIIVPVYNEEVVIEQSLNEIIRSVSEFENDFEVITVDDGSHDQSGEIIHRMSLKDSRIKRLKFSRNFGHQAAIAAGMRYSTGKAVVVIDADLQDPPSVIKDMLEKWREGYHVVYGRRVKRKGETFIKKITAKMFYRFLNMMSEIPFPLDTGDFRLIDRKVVDVMNRMPEKHRYMRGLISWAGYKQTAVDYERDGRAAGETKYSFSKMTGLAMNGIISFSYQPLRLASIAGVIVSLFGFIYIGVVIYQKIFTDTTIPGWASTTTLILFLNGIILIVLGIMGEYIGKIYEESKGRPLYIVEYTEGIE